MPPLNSNNSGQTLQPGSREHFGSNFWFPRHTERRPQVAGRRRGWQARMAGEAIPRPASLDQYWLGSIRTSVPLESLHTNSKSACSTFAADADPPPQLSRGLQSRCNAKHLLTLLSPPIASISIDSNTAPGGDHPLQHRRAEWGRLPWLGGAGRGRGRGPDVTQPGRVEGDHCLAQATQLECSRTLDPLLAASIDRLTTCIKTRISCHRLSCFIEFFAWFHFVCGRYTSD